MEDEERPTEYVVISAGKDGALDQQELEAYYQGPTNSFNNDIVFSNGSFIQYPEGTQQ
jgi:hypothetical protein